MYSYNLRRPREAVRRKRPEKWRKKKLAYTLQQCSSALVGFGQGFLNKEKC